MEEKSKINVKKNRQTKVKITKKKVTREKTEGKELQTDVKKKEDFT